MGSEFVVGKASSLGNDLRALRELRGGMTQQALADAVGVSRQTIIAIERNKYSPSLEVAFRIARALDVSLTEAFWLAD
ncbi:MAG: helix-turn-helix transcriptional regulator [Pseudomonadales bacterium]|nr:helix-turn-helix transcriptional regulator [Pseudomonadales bacterium]